MLKAYGKMAKHKRGGGFWEVAQLERDSCTSSKKVSKKGSQFRNLVVICAFLSFRGVFCGDCVSIKLTAEDAEFAKVLESGLNRPLK
jgi:hypothetical protein